MTRLVSSGRFHRRASHTRLLSMLCRIASLPGIGSKLHNIIVALGYRTALILESRMLGWPGSVESRTTSLRPSLKLLCLRPVGRLLESIASTQMFLTFVLGAGRLGVMTCVPFGLANVMPRVSKTASKAAKSIWPWLLLKVWSSLVFGFGG